MSRTLNPFSEWLGLDPKIKNPHYFQLLGVSTKLTDEQEIRVAVEAGAKRNLELLARLPADADQAMVSAIKKRVRVAHQTLLDPESRIEYLRKLKSQARSTKKQPTSDPSTNQPPSPAPTTSAPPITQPDATQPSSDIESPEAAPPATSPAPGADIPAATTPQVAIPIAMPIGQASPQYAVAAPVAAPAEDELPDSGLKIDTRIRRRRSNPWILRSIVLAILFAIGIGGFLVYDNFEKLRDMGRVPEENTPQNENEAEKPDAPDFSLPKLNTEELPEVDEEGILETLDLPDEQDDEEESEDDDERIGKVLTNRSNSNQTSRFDPPPNAIGPAPKSESVAPVVVELSDIDLARLRRNLIRARYSLFRRDKGLALIMINRAAEILEQAAPSDKSFVFSQRDQPLTNLVDDAREIFDLIDGFWLQMVASAKNIPGGKQIVMGEQIVGFIEGLDDRFTIRNGGMNVTYEYHFCPPGLAIEIARMGAVEDVPTWSMQQAAFYAVNQIHGREYSRQINELISGAQDAGHTCDSIRRFADFKIGTVGTPRQKLGRPDFSKTGEALAEFRRQNSYRKVNDLKPKQAATLAETLLKISSPDPAQHVGFLEEVRRLAVKGMESAKAEDAIIEMADYADIDQTSLMENTILKIAKGNLDDRQRRELMEIGIPYLKSELGRQLGARQRKTLAARLLKIAADHKMTDSARRLMQLDKASQ